MSLRKSIVVEGVPFRWLTNLNDDDIREFYSLYAARICLPAPTKEESPYTLRIPVRAGLLPFHDGLCLWSANGEEHTVHYRSAQELAIFEARHEEIGELREEQAAERAAEHELLVTEDNHLQTTSEAQIAAGQYDAAAESISARAQLRAMSREARGAARLTWFWSCDLLRPFTQFPTSIQGIEFLQQYNPTSQAFANFAHWFADCSRAKSDQRIEQTRRIYEEAMRMFPHDARLAKEACLFWRRVGRYDLAIEICADAIHKGLRDGTKSGFAGRLERLLKESSKRK